MLTYKLGHTRAWAKVLAHPVFGRMSVEVRTSNGIKRHKKWRFPRRPMTSGKPTI